LNSKQKQNYFPTFFYEFESTLQISCYSVFFSFFDVVKFRNLKQLSKWEPLKKALMKAKLQQAVIDFFDCLLLIHNEIDSTPQEEHSRKPADLFAAANKGSASSNPACNDPNIFHTLEGHEECIVESRVSIRRRNVLRRWRNSFLSFVRGRRSLSILEGTAEEESNNSRVHSLPRYHVESVQALLGVCLLRWIRFAKHIQRPQPACFLGSNL
jgi:hypothetical protein